MRYCSLIPLLFFSLSTSALPIEALEEKLPKGSQLALTIEKTTSYSRLFEQNQDLLLPPASTLKLFTATAAYLSLPEDFRFETHVLTDGSDVTFKFGGDPTFMREHLNSLVNKIKASFGERKIHDIWLDTQIFSGYNKGVGWPWDILGVCYSAPASALTLEQNCVQASIYTNKDTGTTRAFVPVHQPITLITHAKTVSLEKQQKTFCDLELDYNADNQYTLSGCIVDRPNALPLQFAVQNPERYFQAILKKLLKQADIQMMGEIKIGSPEGSAKLIASHYSAPRDTLITKMLHESDNLIADNLLKFIGHTYYKTSGTFSNGANALKEIMLNKTGIDLTQSVIVDGSGLSRNNRITANQLSSLLRWMSSSKGKTLLAMLPISGRNGTLKYRRSLLSPELKNRVYAKSGSLFGSHNLAGIIHTKSGDTLTFVQLISSYYVPDKHQNKKTPTPITQFEKSLYEELVNDKIPTSKQ